MKNLEGSDTNGNSRSNSCIELENSFYNFLQATSHLHKEGDIMTQKEQKVYNALIALSLFLLIVMPMQIKIFWYGLRIVVLLSMILFLTYIARNKDKENKDMIIFKVSFWLEILLYFVYRQYSIHNIIYLSAFLIGYIIILFLCFAYGKRIKWKNSVVFLTIESGLFVFMVFDIFKYF